MDGKKKLSETKRKSLFEFGNINRIVDSFEPSLDNSSVFCTIPCSTAELATEQFPNKHPKIRLTQKSCAIILIIATGINGKNNKKYLVDLFEKISHEYTNSNPLINSERLREIIP